MTRSVDRWSMALLILILGLAGCDDGKAIREIVERVDRLQKVVEDLQHRLANVETRTKAELGPMQEDLAAVVDAIDAAAKTPGVFKTNYVFLEAMRLGEGMWRTVWGKKDGTGFRLMADVRKTAVGYKWDGAPLLARQ